MFLFRRMPLGPSLLRLKLTDPILLHLWVYAFPYGHFETLTIRWNQEGLRAEAISKNRSLVCRLEPTDEAWTEYSYEREGAFCVFSKDLADVLSFATLTRHGEAPVESEWQFEPNLLRIRTTVQGWGKLNRILRHVPDALLRQLPEPEFEKSAWVASKSPAILKEVQDALVASQLVKVELSGGKIVFRDPGSRDDWFEPSGLATEFQAQTLLDRSSIDVASKIIDHAQPSGFDLSILEMGFGRIRYQYPTAHLTYLLAAAIGPE